MNSWSCDSSAPIRFTVMKMWTGPIHKLEKSLQIWIDNQILKQTPFKSFYCAVKCCCRLAVVLLLYTTKCRVLLLSEMVKVTRLNRTSMQLSNVEGYAQEHNSLHV